MSRGRILEPPTFSRPGIVLGEDGNRYNLLLSEWRESAAPDRGNVVDYEINEDGQAVSVYLDPSYAPTPAAVPYHAPTPATVYTKSKVAAALLAFFLGMLGVHKFYLGYGTQGVILLIATIIGWATAILFVGFIILIAVAVVCLIEFVIYLTKSDEDFHRIYVENRKPWF